jgi:SAM-dependent methyltransferase
VRWSIQVVHVCFASDADIASANPETPGQRTLSEVLRVVKPGGKVIIVDYARPRWWHPLRYLFPILLANLEPFALDLWREEITGWLPGSCEANAHRRLFFGGLYQLVVSGDN